ncbi:MAG: hypothetical protein JW819_01220 [Candidatus Krumholzibacteriota bacterium]|nr:hypothetical protein [Candidatus Krumholzibacteriota bacterium]
MYLTGLIQRDRLFELVQRWFADRPEPGDGRFLTEVFIYESLVTRPGLRRFLADICGAVCPGPLRARRVFAKDAVREAIVASCREPDARARELFERWRRRPEDFFPGTPTDIILFQRPDGRLVGMTRIKRIRRIVEKASRRVSDRLAGAIGMTARSLAEKRARELGMPLERLISDAATMDADFAAAEEIISQAFRGAPRHFQPADLRIDDVIGAKFVGRPDTLVRLERAVAAYPGARITERKEHRGAYNDVNLLVDLELPPPGELIDALRGRDWSFAARRGLPPEQLAAEFPAYVESGARTVRCEVILTTWPELVESEFGRSLHEARILRQRHRAGYDGRIANNAAYLISYLMMLAISPETEVRALPFKMWGRYLPDMAETIIWRLFGVANGTAILDTFLLPPQEEDLSGEAALAGEG